MTHLIAAVNSSGVFATSYEISRHVQEERAKEP